MTPFAKIISLGILSISLSNPQETELYKRWRIIGDKRIFLNLDGTAHNGFRSRIDSVKNDSVFIELFKDRNFKSVEGDGRFFIIGDSLHLNMPEGKSSFEFEIKADSLYLVSDEIRRDYIRREVLHAVAQ